MRTFKLLLRRLDAATVAVAVAAAVILSAALDQAIGVPGRVSVVAEIWPLLPVIPMVVLLHACYYLAESIERISSRAMAPRKVGHVVLSIVALAVLVLLLPPQGGRFVAARNSCLLLGQTYLLAGLVPRTWATLTLVLTPAAMWLIGTQPPGVPPAGWAPLIHPQESTGAAIVAVALLVLGLLVFAVKGPRVVGSVE